VTLANCTLIARWTCTDLGRSWHRSWALLTLCQLLRLAVTDAIETRPGTDPDRASFTSALEAARDQLTAAVNVLPATPAQPGAIGRAVLATLLPARRSRYSARTVKCSTSRYHENDDSRPRLPPPSPRSALRPHPAPGQRSPSRARYSTRAPRQGQPPTRRQRITAIMTSQRPRGWSGTELAQLLGVKPRNMLTQLGEWTKLGFLTRTGRGTYTLNTPTPASSATAPDP
jgi:hypothetical protein